MLGLGLRSGLGLFNDKDRVIVSRAKRESVFFNDEDFCREVELKVHKYPLKTHEIGRNSVVFRPIDVKSSAFRSSRRRGRDGGPETAAASTPPTQSVMVS